jgi:hypothetical protein
MKFKIIANEQTPGIDPYLWSYEKSLKEIKPDKRRLM